MKLAMTINYAGDFQAAVRLAQDLERAGVDLVWVAEAYSFDSISMIGYLAAKTSTIHIGTGIINVYSRTATAVAQTAAGCDFVTGGRFVLGLGASGPQVIEGFHGVPYDKPMARIIDYINVCRIALRREPVVYDGQTVHIPLPAGQGTGLGKPLKIINHPVRPVVPIFWASVKGNSVAATARIADGWMPIFFDPTKFAEVWGGDLRARLRRARSAARPAADLCRGDARYRRRVRRYRRRHSSRSRPPDVRPVHRRDGCQGPELLHRPRRPVRLRTGSQGDPGPLSRRQQGRGSPRSCPGRCWSTRISSAPPAT